MNKSDPLNGERLLSSWKEIATCLNRGVRTVQRWEHYGLPVRRPAGAASNVVIAVESDLREWMENSRGRRLKDEFEKEELELLAARLTIVKQQLQQIDTRVTDLQIRLEKLIPEIPFSKAS